MRGRLLVGMVAIALTACATDYTFEREYRRTLQGIVTNKTELSQEEVAEKLRELRRRQILGTIAVNLVTVPAGWIVIPVGKLVADSQQYEVTLADGARLQVLNKFAGFNVGECVAVFLSEDWERYPPRMAYSTTDCAVDGRKVGAGNL